MGTAPKPGLRKPGLCLALSLLRGKEDLRKAEHSV